MGGIGAMGDAVAVTSGTIAVVAADAVAGDPVQLPRYAWTAEVMLASAAHPFFGVTWGYDAGGDASFALPRAGLELTLLQAGALRLAFAPAVFAGLGLPRTAVAPRAPSFDVGVVAGPRVRVAIGPAAAGASILVGIPFTGTWTVVTSSSFVESTTPPVGFGIGGELGLALAL